VVCAEAGRREVRRQRVGTMWGPRVRAVETKMEVARAVVARAVVVRALAGRAAANR
jgi:hypothetical protein